MAVKCHLVLLMSVKGYAILAHIYYLNATRWVA